VAIVLRRFPEALAALVKEHDGGRLKDVATGLVGAEPMPVPSAPGASGSGAGVQGDCGAHHGAVGYQGLIRWIDVTMTLWLGRRMKPTTIT